MTSPYTHPDLSAWSAILQPDQNINRRTCHRTVPMQVISLGAPRTGTLSMAEAYAILAIPSYHYASIFANCRDADMWIEGLDAKFSASSKRKEFGKDEFDQLLGHVGAVTDVPCIVFWRELVEAYPEAKVVLVERDEEKWMESMRKLVEGILNPGGRYVLRFTDPWRTGRILGCGMMWIRCWFGVEGSLTVESAMAGARSTYRRHYEEIRRVVPKDRLLEYRLGSGWKPLCEFLEKEVPSVPFPRRNDATTLDKAFGTFLATALKSSLFNLSLVGAVGAVVVVAVMKMRP